MAPTRDSTLDALLAGTFPDPDGGAPLAAPTRSVAIAETLAGRESALVAALGLGPRLALVADDNTYRVLGERVAAALGTAVQEIRLPGRPHADMATAERLRRDSADCDALIAVGSGTINDLCKYAAACDGKPYAVFATAPSMNGYTSVNAALTEHGHKKSLRAQGAAGVFIDLEVFARAPARMIRAGLGDSLCRPTAQADWLLAHRLLGRSYRRAPFDLLAGDEAPLIAEPEGLLGGDLDAMTRLARTLVLSGFGMTICGGSHPASQGEHLIAHYLEMMMDPSLPTAFHGEQIAVATLTMARLQERMLAGPPPVVRPSRLDPAEFEGRYGPATGRSCWAEFAAKQLDDAAAAALNERLAGSWARIAGQIAEVSLPAASLHDTVKKIAGPTTAADLGLPSETYRDAVLHAREIRNRYTFLDLAADSGALESFAA